MVSENQYALITGATSGIGYELAKRFAMNGYNLVLVARSSSMLEKVAKELYDQYGVKTVHMAKDLFNINAASELYNEVKMKGITVNVLVNDAGQGVYGNFAETDLARQIQIIQLNVISLTTLTYHFLKDMIARNEGKILQLASTVSILPAPLQAVYCGTKAFVLNFTEAIISEIKGTDVTITALQPGVTDTDFFNKAGAQKSKLVQDKSSMADPADVAKDGYDALMRGDQKVVSGMKNKFHVAMSHVTPDGLLADTLKKMSAEVDAGDEKK